MSLYSFSPKDHIILFLSKRECCSISEIKHYYVYITLWHFFKYYYNYIVLLEC